MSSTINASTASGGGVITTADASGILQLQTGGTTALTIDALQNVTLAKGLTVGANAAPAFSAYGTGSQTVTSGVTTKVSIDTEIFDTNSNFDNVTNSRFTPTVAGYYQVNGVVRGSATSSTLGIIAQIYKNGASYSIGGSQSYSTNIAVGISVTLSEVVYMNGSTDYIELWGSVTGTGTCSFISTSAAACCRFSAAMIRSA